MSSAEFLQKLAGAVPDKSYLLGKVGVLGYGIGFRIRGGRRTDEPALVVYVRKGRKAEDPRRLPRHARIPNRVRIVLEGRSEWLPVDIVEDEVGNIAEATSGPPVSPVVIPGHRIFNRDHPENWGTVGWVARDGQIGETVVCAAYHVLMRPLTGYPAKRIAQEYVHAPSDPERILGTADDPPGSHAYPMGQVWYARRDRQFDVGTVRLHPAAEAARYIRYIGSMGPLRYLGIQDLQGEAGEPVRLAAGAPAPSTGHVYEFPSFFPMRYPDWPGGLNMAGLIATDIPVSPGDSGGLLVDAGRRPIGMLVGSSATRSFFMHLGETAKALGLSDPAT